ncbi:MAG: C45 family autoproteolytic acyltransferase/hydrolase [Candidatus Omnitrophica bacterium]|nr:C45 family autoproteolytic acyltransferase/hydrolase [Candidatus Omnitrophota bacterium]
MKKIFLTVIIFLSLLTLSYSDNSHPIFHSSFEGGKRYKIGKFDLLQLNGDYRNMGRQYGALMKEELNNFYKLAIEKNLLRREDLEYQEIEDIAETIFDTYPKRFKEIIYGMAETSKMDVNKLIILDQIIAISYVNNTLSNFGCSSLVAWDDYTSGGPLVFGRNFDYVNYFKRFAEFITITVFNPSDSSVPTAIIGYAGQICLSTGMNKEGLFIENNEAIVSGGNVFYSNRIHTFIQELGFLFNCSTLDNLEDSINTNRSNCSLIANVADKTKAYSYEWPPFDVRRREPDRPGLLVSTNHFVDSSWGIVEPIYDTDDLTVRRRRNLLALAEKYRGNFSAKKMMQVFDVSVKDGGATLPKETIYQIVAVPAELKFWLKAPRFQDWTGIELNQFFISSN